MAIIWTNKKELDAEFKRFENRYNDKAVELLLRLGEQVVKRARENGSYTDRTSNLRNSIGYLVIHNGRIVQTSFTGNTPSRNGKGDLNFSHKTGLDYAKDVASNLDRNKTYLVWVAGMEYAAIVESKGYDVLQGSKDWAESEAQKQIEKFKRFLLGKK